ncbi:MAG: hypothetical protein AAF460_16945 [Pseudomonadota bacterium]
MGKSEGRAMQAMRALGAVSAVFTVASLLLTVWTLTTDRFHTGIDWVEVAHRYDIQSTYNLSPVDVAFIAKQVTWAMQRGDLAPFAWVQIGINTLLLGVLLVCALQMTGGKRDYAWPFVLVMIGMAVYWYTAPTALTQHMGDPVAFLMVTEPAWRGWSPIVNSHFWLWAPALALLLLALSRGSARSVELTST